MPDLSTVRGKSRGSTFPALLNSFKQEIANALPKHLSADRMARIALTEFRKNKQLQACEPRSIFASVVVASQAGLEPGVMGQGYLIPYKNRRANQYECQFVPGWRGLVDLVNRAGRATVWTGAVFEGDQFEYAMGDRPHIIHRPSGEDDYDRLTHVYAVGRVKNSEWPVIEVWTKDKVERHRDRYNKVGDRHYSYTYPEMYARKVVLMQVLKYMPASIELSRAMELESAAESGTHIDLMEAASGEWIPSEDGNDSVDTAPQEDPAPVQGGPLSIDEDGIWRDKAGAEFDPDLHVWDDKHNRPLVAARGRNAGKFIERENVTDIE